MHTKQAKQVSMASMALMLMISFPLVVHAAGYDAAAPAVYGYLAQVTDTRFLPETIYSGNLVSLAADIRNGASSLSAGDMNVSLSLGDGFELVQASSYLGTLDSSETKTAVMTFRVKDSTPPGYYSALLTMNYTNNGIRSSQSQTLQVPVTTSQRNMEVTLSPTIISPGKEEELRFTLKNFSGLAVSNISFSWNEKNNAILPVGSDNKRYLSILNSGETATLSYMAATDPSISPGIYSLDISLNYIDSNGTRTSSSRVGLLVGGETAFEVGAQLLSSGQLSLNIANIGSNNAQGLVVKIPQQQGIQVSSGIQVLGNLNKGDFTIATFDLAGSAQASVQSSQGAGVQRGGLGRGIIPIRVGGGGGSQQPQNSNSGAQSTSLGFSSRGIDPAKSSIDVQIDYTDTAGIRRTTTITAPVGRQSASLSAGAGSASEAAESSYVRGSGMLSGGVIMGALLLFAAAAYNFARAKKDWKALGLRLAAAMAIMAGSILLGNQLAEYVAVAASAGILVHFFMHAHAGNAAQK